MAVALQDKLRRQESTAMDMIAAGVEERLDRLTGHSENVISETVKVAQSLGLDEKLIKSWVEKKTAEDLTKKKCIDISVKKLERNALGQTAIGIAPYHIVSPPTREKFN